MLKQPAGSGIGRPVGRRETARIQQQKDVDDVVRNLAKGVEATAPETGQEAAGNAGKERSVEAGCRAICVAAADQESNAAAEQQKAADAGDQKAADEAAARLLIGSRAATAEGGRNAAPRAEAAANELAQAAKSRNEIADAAKNLAEMTSEQLAVSMPLRSRSPRLRLRLPPIRRLRKTISQQLNEARDKVADAAAQQQKAADDRKQQPDGNSVPGYQQGRLSSRRWRSRLLRISRPVKQQPARSRDRQQGVSPTRQKNRMRQRTLVLRLGSSEAGRQGGDELAAAP